MANSYGNNHEPGRSVNGSSSFNRTNQINGNSRSPPPPPQPENSVAHQPMQHSSGLAMEWTPEEQAILEENLSKYASEQNIVRYAKIAVLLQNKTVRDVAFRCRWMNRKESSKRRKDDHSLLRKSKERKEKVIDPSARSSHFAAMGGANGQLLQQNAQAFEQISANFKSYQMHENIGLFCQVRDNILNIFNNLRDTQDIMKQMPPLPVKLNEKLANLILPQKISTFPTDTINNDGSTIL